MIKNETDPQKITCKRRFFMRKLIRFSVVSIIIMMALCIVPGCSSTGATKDSATNKASQIDQDADEALYILYAGSPAAVELSKIAKGILVFPTVTKGGLMVGGSYGKGALRKGGATVGYYNTVSASYGLQAGAQRFGYALFFMDDASLEYLGKSDGWEIGIGPTVVIVDEGLSRSLSSTTAREGVYAFFFDQRGLMAGLGIQGSKITRIEP
jgi:lipid-binding SYLF domain-containing protein